jgi:hypothetical protein
VWRPPAVAAAIFAAKRVVDPLQQRFERVVPLAGDRRPTLTVTPSFAASGKTQLRPHRERRSATTCAAEAGFRHHDDEFAAQAPIRSTLRICARARRARQHIAASEAVAVVDPLESISASSARRGRLAGAPSVRGAQRHSAGLEPGQLVRGQRQAAL